MTTAGTGARYRVQPGGEVAGELTVPGDKSISHRALMLGGIAEGETEITGFLAGEDCLATLRALQALGVQHRAARAAASACQWPRRGRPEAPPAAPLEYGQCWHRDAALHGTARAAGVRLHPDRRRVADAPADGAGGGAAASHGRRHSHPAKVGRRCGLAALPELRALDYALPVASAQVEIGRPAGGPQSLRPHPGHGAGAVARSHRAHAECVWRRGSAGGCDRRRRGRATPQRQTGGGAGRLLLRGFLSGCRLSGGRAGSPAAQCRRQPDPYGAARDAAAHGSGYSGACGCGRRRAPAASRSPTSRCARAG